MSAPPQHCTEPLRVFWQPGCTSCLRTKEFLQAHGVPFESMNVLEGSAAADALRRLGARSVPVVARGDVWVLAQDLGDVARFVGIDLQRSVLPPAMLVERLDGLLAFAAATVARFPDARLDDCIPTRPRSYADIAFHVGMIVQGLLDAADPQRGGELTYAHFERRPERSQVAASALSGWLQSCRAQLADWWRAHSAAASTRLLRTYYGERPLHEVLERSAWHVAQHVRQVDFIAAEVLRLDDLQRLPAALLEGLPVPREVWDAEIRFA